MKTQTLIKELNKIVLDPVKISDGINFGHFKLIYIINREKKRPEIIKVEGNEKNLIDNFSFYKKQIKGIYGI